MVKITKLNGQIEAINAELIESVEATPDTMLRLTTGRRLVIKNSVDDLIAKVIEYRKLISTKISVIERTTKVHDDEE